VLVNDVVLFVANNSSVLSCVVIVAVIHCVKSKHKEMSTVILTDTLEPLHFVCS